MALEYIEEGKKYKLELLCIHNKEKVIVFETTTGDHIPLRIADLECVSPANDTKNAETAPKYDPNREFRKGDKVRLVQCNGRNPFDSFNGIEYLPDETIYTVDGDEYDNGKVELYAMDSCDTFEIHHSNIELVTPVEELEPYSVSEATVQYLVKEDNKKVVAQFCKLYHPNAKSAAEAERDRLNAEWRKEQE